MRFKSTKAKDEDRRRWHPWFAWRPVRIKEEIVWWELILRKWDGGPISGKWVYEID